jgi:predicted nuclease of predicted toxin-antitoxin system
VRALLDEQLSPQIAALLRHAGYDVLAVADRDELVGSSDRIVLDVASSEGRALVTNNIKDFRPLAAEWLAAGRTHPGLILLPSARRRTRPAVAALATAIEAVLRAHPDGIAGSERWVGPLTTQSGMPG